MKEIYNHRTLEIDPFVRHVHISFSPLLIQAIKYAHGAISMTLGE
jgi:hypothetical protein